MEKQTDWAQIINWILTILLIVAVLLAVQQRFLEDRKCIEWSKDRTFEITNGIYNSEYSCELQCNSSFAPLVQNNQLADKSANYGEELK